MSFMRKKVYVDVPEQPDVEMFVFIDRPKTIYINNNCKRKGVTKIVTECLSAHTNNQQNNKT